MYNAFTLPDPVELTVIVITETLLCQQKKKKKKKNPDAGKDQGQEVKGETKDEIYR